MAPILSLLFVLFGLWLLNRIATIALVLTGLSLDSAEFQVRSALLGVGFTTSESELIVQHPVRRKIFLLLMLAGNTGIITAMVSLIITFMAIEQAPNLLHRLWWVVVGVAFLVYLARSRWVARHLSRIIKWALSRWTDIVVRDYESLMQLSEGYGISEMKCRSDEWVVDRTLGDLGLRREGVLVLGIFREKGSYVGAPKAHTRIGAGDTLILYGRTDMVSELSIRRKGLQGEREHRKAEQKFAETLSDQGEELPGAR
ncbi:MAG: hypothetical protein ACI9TH_002959 [Kiritimatiellia bacterium]|jgi:hypothetical protein